MVERFARPAGPTRIIPQAPGDGLAVPLSILPKRAAPPGTLMAAVAEYGRLNPGSSEFSNSTCLTREPSGFFTSMVQWPRTAMPSCEPFAAGFAVGEASALAGVAAGFSAESRAGGARLRAADASRRKHHGKKGGKHQAPPGDSCNRFVFTVRLHAVSPYLGFPLFDPWTFTEYSPHPSLLIVIRRLSPVCEYR